MVSVHICENKKIRASKEDWEYSRARVTIKWVVGVDLTENGVF